MISKIPNASRTPFGATQRKRGGEVSCGPFASLSREGKNRRTRFLSLRCSEKKKLLSGSEVRYNKTMGFWKNNLCFRAIFLLLSAALSGIALSADAARLDEVKSKINQKNQDIAALEKEIREYEKKISTTAQEANTLSNAVKNLDATRQKIQRDISVTGSKIERTNLNIERLGIEIGTKETSIGT